jgi:hypothetical protein
MLKAGRYAHLWNLQLAENGKASRHNELVWRFYCKKTTLSLIGYSTLKVILSYPKNIS